MFLLATVILNFYSLAVQPNEQYEATALELAKNNHTDLNIKDIAAGSNGYINYFIKEDRAGLPVPPIQFRSLDYGKTWEILDLNWFKEIEKNYPNYGAAKDFYIAENGDIYCLATVGKKEESFNGISYAYDLFGVFKYTNGKVQRIPNLTLGYHEQPDYWIGYVYENGDIAIGRINVPEALKEVTGVSIYNNQGQLKSNISMVNTVLPQVITHDAVYGFNHNEQSAGIEAYDIRTGKKKLAIPYSKDMQFGMDAIGVSPNGTIYVAMASGLYKCATNETSFTQLLGSDKISPIIKYSSIRMACSDDGTVYWQIFDSSRGRQNSNSPFGKLYRFRPIKK